MISTPTKFHPHQILCLEHGDICLYAEVIQIIPERKLCWVRPLALVQTDSSPLAMHQPNSFHDLRQGADLLCPQSLFRVALDTEVIPILTELNAIKPQAEDSSASLEENYSARRLLQEFIHQVWKTVPEAFQL